MKYSSDLELVYQLSINDSLSFTSNYQLSNYQKNQKKIKVFCTCLQQMELQHIFSSELSTKIN